MGCSHLVLCAEKKPDFWKCTSSHICAGSHPKAASKTTAIPRMRQKEGQNEKREKEREREGKGRRGKPISSTKQDRAQAVQSLPGFPSYPWKEGKRAYMVTWNTSKKSKQILASLENQKHNDTIMLAVYFSLPRAAWQNVTVKSSRHERLTDVYFATRLHTFLLQDFCTCREVSAAAPSPTAPAPQGNPTTSAVGTWLQRCDLCHHISKLGVEEASGLQELCAIHKGCDRIALCTEAQGILGLEKSWGCGPSPGIGWMCWKSPSELGFHLIYFAAINCVSLGIECFLEQVDLLSAVSDVFMVRNNPLNRGLWSPATNRQQRIPYKWTSVSDWFPHSANKCEFRI